MSKIQIFATRSDPTLHRLKYRSRKGLQNISQVGNLAVLNGYAEDI